METVKLGAATEYIPGRVNVGLYLADEGVWLVDSGLDDEAGRKIARLLEERNIPLRRIVTTHSNADHCGGNAFLRKRTGCSVAATELESVVMENPFLEPLLLWSAFPFAELGNKFLQAKPSEVDMVIGNRGIFDESGLEAVPLPGHFLDMIGLRTPDDVLFVADSVFSAELIEKYAVMFVLDVGAALETIDRLTGTEAAWFVPSHAPATENILPLAEANRKGLLRVSEAVLDCCGEPASREEILKCLADRFSLSMSVSEYVLNSAAVGAHLSWLRKRGEVAPVVEKGVLLWRKTP
ncbi:glyoxylase-like metal-dependent hydrolase (beta-lactamase superfamily II) [Aminivibrio pyruvatiphilus]|uniref:Glyoxylase-like metal-dependent hydrolase (Beta-lactamase superfamily II) n=1 Tax=Aminivibrio pyruvatiphilus TaxID=1005740 RepID=A0A4R8MCB7_9BACT|nr:MBL fold metallo-hydrolase [Aminivibrio pyruvatiphilus]TDY61922.1 glyoxylase-like metal-dependent hydrolase (beta-lactamase superfamily II) [Aminivibrio pyruvatiphilus]